jgi:hypothetical protein
LNIEILTESEENVPKLRRKISYEWFVEPLNSHTNEVIMKRCSAEETLDEFMCGDGTPRNLIRCTFRFITFLVESQVILKIKFRIFKRQGVSGKIKDIDSFVRKEMLSDSSANRKKSYVPEVSV